LPHLVRRHSVKVKFLAHLFSGTRDSSPDYTNVTWVLSNINVN
jgi:hypothetical protein